MGGVIGVTPTDTADFRHQSLHVLITGGDFDSALVHEPKQVLAGQIDKLGIRQVYDQEFVRRAGGVCPPALLQHADPGPSESTFEFQMELGSTVMYGYSHHRFPFFCQEKGVADSTRTSKPAGVMSAIRRVLLVNLDRRTRQPSVGGLEGVTRQCRCHRRHGAEQHFQGSKCQSEGHYKPEGQYDDQEKRLHD
jgi:hypothetical protein